MPELPEVQTIVNDLIQAHLVGCVIEKIFIYWPRSVAKPDTESFCQKLSNQTIQKIERRGKYLVFSLSSHLFLCIHLRMTGRLLLVSKHAFENSHTRLRLDLNGEKALFYQDTRKFGRWSLVSDLKEILGHLGPEPLDQAFSYEDFYQLLKVKSRPLKSLLLDQTFIAGLGNIYVDEALWQAQLHPLQKASLLTKTQGEKLLMSIREVLYRGIENRGTSLGNGKANYQRLDGEKGQHQTLLTVFRRTNHPCFKCKTPIQRITVAQRSTHFCPLCQQINFS